jgi:hypothetical protein
MALRFVTLVSFFQQGLIVGNKRSADPSLEVHFSSDSDEVMDSETGGGFGSSESRAHVPAHAGENSGLTGPSDRPTVKVRPLLLAALPTAVIFP